MGEYSSNILTAHVKEDYIRQMISLMKNQTHGISKKMHHEFIYKISMTPDLFSITFSTIIILK